ncbi:MAG: stage II sporulation protein M [Candidatus Woesearchaeota archaeon]|nr:stage II sporulation protein M [Candidatus Woesearchaeota archaeon]
MVFEHLFPSSLLERKEWTGFFLAFIYATISIVIARLLFAANSGIVSVIFVSIFLLPYFSTILKREERQEEQEKNKNFLTLLKDNWDAIQIYIFIFLGIYLAYMLYSFLAPYLGYDVSRIFREQLSLESVRGGVTFSFSTFFDILLNNWWVLLACFIVSLVAGDGAIFFIAWNASTWGTIFGYRAIAASSFDGRSALIALLIIFLVTLPHLLLEGSAYILAAISGGVISDEIVQKSEEIRSFVLFFLCGAFIYVLLFILVKSLFPRVVAGVLAIVLALGILYCMHYLFDNTNHALIFRYNFYLFAFAIGVFVVGALVETFVLHNVGALRSVYLAAMIGG